jgi:hypothetical protein
VLVIVAVPQFGVKSLVRGGAVATRVAAAAKKARMVVLWKCIMMD